MHACIDSTNAPVENLLLCIVSAHPARMHVCDATYLFLGPDTAIPEEEVEER